MAFSYSDKNFTVVGNLCFVHILSKKVGSNSYAIPPAIVNRMLAGDFQVVYAWTNEDFSGHGLAYCNVTEGKVEFEIASGVHYINFFFPIDSNK